MYFLLTLIREFLSFHFARWHFLETVKNEWAVVQNLSVSIKDSGATLLDSLPVELRKEILSREAVLSQ